MEGLRLIIGNVPGLKDVVLSNKGAKRARAPNDEDYRIDGNITADDDDHHRGSSGGNNNDGVADDPQLVQFLEELSAGHNNYYLSVIEEMNARYNPVADEERSALDQNRIDYERRFQEVHKANLEVANERLAEPSSSTLGQWPRRFLDFVASDLLTSSLKKTKSSKRRSTLIRAVNKVKFLKGLQAAMKKNSQDFIVQKEDKARIKREIREMKAIGRADHSVDGIHNSDRNPGSGTSPYFRRKQAIELDLGVLESKLEGEAEIPLTCR